MKLHPHNADAFGPLSYRHRRWIQKSSTILALLLIMVAFLVSVKQRKGPKTSRSTAQPITDYHAYQKYTECGYLRIPDQQRWSFT